MIEIQDVHFRYPRGKDVFEHLSLSLLPGRIYGLLGLNGTGKTTLLKRIAALRYPAHGVCSVSGVSSVPRSKAYLEQFFLIPEECVLPPLRVDAYCRLYAPFYREFSADLFRSILGEFEIQEQDSISGMSFGTRKKVLIAFALAARTRVVLMDEPTNGLDIPSKKQFRKVLAEQISEDRCFVISTHQVRDLGNMLDHLVMLHERQILLDASVAEIAARVVFEETTEKPQDEILYMEKNFNGYRVLRRNLKQQETPLDTELLFNAALANPKEFRAVLTSKESAL